VGVLLSSLNTTGLVSFNEINFSVFPPPNELKTLVSQQTQAVGLANFLLDLALWLTSGWFYLVIFKRSYSKDEKLRQLIS
jgi:hypothetical protein